MLSVEKIIHVDGHNGKIELTENALLIRRKGLLSGISKLHDKEISLGQIATIEFEKATLFVNGYIQIIPVGCSAVKGVFANTKNENAVIFTYFHRVAFEALFTELQLRVNSLRDEQRVHVAVVEEAKPTAFFRDEINVEGQKAKNFANLYAFVCAVGSTFLVGYFVEPLTIKYFDFTITWWMYLLIFLVIFGSLVQKLAKVKAMENLAYGEVRTRVVNLSSDAFCSKCGAANTIGDKFCSKCGNRR